MYGEWLYAKHTVFYDDLPHYFMEFDVLDTCSGSFLSTPRRRRLLKGLPVASAPVLRQGEVPSIGHLESLIGPSRFIRPGHVERLRALCLERNLDPRRALGETDLTGLMEGLYIKVEEKGLVSERCKFVRAGFLQAVFSAEGHWLDRPIIPNLLREGVTLYG